MRELLLKLYKSDSKMKNALAIFIMTVFMIRFINLKAIKRTRDALVKAGESTHPFRLFWDIFIWNLIFGYDASDYAEYHFIDKSRKERLSFISFNEQVLFSRSINLNAKVDILGNKHNTYKYFIEHYHREQIMIKSKDDRNTFKDFITRHSRFFYKPLDSSGGMGARIIDVKDINPDSIFDEIVSSGACLLEEIIVQCEEMSRFNSSSINTVRTALVNTSNGIEILFAEIRCGRAGSIVDNGRSGGILVPCDLKTGILCKYGYDGLGRKYSCHPDSKVVFENYQVPKWQEIVDLSEELMSRIPNLKYVGWDIAITKDHLAIVEGNSRPMFGGLQGMHKTGFKYELLEILKKDRIPDNFRPKQQEIFK